MKYLYNIEFTFYPVKNVATKVVQVQAHVLTDLEFAAHVRNKFLSRFYIHVSNILMPIIPKSDNNIF